MKQKALFNVIQSSDESDYLWDRVLKLEGVARKSVETGLFDSVRRDCMRSILTVVKMVSDEFYPRLLR